MKNARPARFRPAVESLEAREVPAFLSPVASQATGSDLFVSDFNRDGLSDIVIFGDNKKLTSHLSNGDGTFRAIGTSGTAKGSELRDLHLGDTNGDGNLDVVATLLPRRADIVMGYYSGTIYENIWLGKRDGTFDSVRTRTYEYAGPLQLGSLPRSRTAYGDFDHDGLFDSASTSNYPQDLVTVRLSDGLVQTYSVGRTPFWIATGDFNGDGWTDLVVVGDVSSGNPNLSTLLNDGNW